MSTTRRVWRDIYDQNALWQCRQTASGCTHTIGGALAQILKHYPEEYELTFLAPEGVTHEYDA